MLNKLVCGLVLLSLPPTLVAAGDVQAGKQKAATCVACHGPDGNSGNPTWPNLAGQHAEYIRKQLQDFREGRRKNDQMSPFAAALSDQDIADLAVYYASLAPKIGHAQPEHLEPGARLYRAGDAAKGMAACMACHGPAGTGNPAANYPRINAQHATYTELQLKAFKAEARANDVNGVMRDIAGRMSNDSIKAVADYLQGLH
ncbi:MAG: c-type cytochrome [Gammaproteobacteria bacterium]|nr:c-type cytochrome [Gammaproteobacteria bacterium]MCY4281974.1 c-type cytochrome [Gammaproteobacteria bacterium]